MGEGLEVWPLQIRAEDLPDALGARKLLEADEARAVAKQSTARPPMRGFSGQRRLAHAAHRVQHDGAVRVVLLVGVFASTLCAHDRASVRQIQEILKVRTSEGFRNHE